MSFRREKFVPRGGPDGGDGGNGGDVVVQSDAALHTLLDLRYHSYNFAESGVHGKGKKMHGRCGADLTIRVPLGTLLKAPDTNEGLWDFQGDGRRFVAARGGRGVLLVRSQLAAAPVRRTPRSCRALSSTQAPWRV